MAVAWTASVQTTGSDVTAYDLRHIQTDAAETVDSNWTVVEDVWTADAGGNLEYAVTGLTGGAQYDVQLPAINEWGAGDWSAAASATPQNALPSFNEGTTAARSVAENTPAGGTVGDPVAATDDAAALAYTLAGPDAALFEVVAEPARSTSARPPPSTSRTPTTRTTNTRSPSPQLTRPAPAPPSQ